MASTLSDDSAPSASLDHLEAQAAPTHPKAPPEHLGSLPWPQEPATGRPKVEDSPLSTSRRLPALGVSWANCVNTRLLLSRRTRATAAAPPELALVPFLPPPHAAPTHAAPPHAAPPHAAYPLAPFAQWPPGGAPTGAAPTGAQPTGDAERGAEQTVRQLAICWSPRLPYTSCEFEVHHDGVRGCAQHTLLETSESALAR